MIPAIFLHTCDSTMASEWRAAFAGIAGVYVGEEDILAGNADAIISPANSFGYMDGGIDLAYRKFFGDQVQVELQELIFTQFYGELVVGHAAIIPTGHAAFPHLVSAPTMRVPDRIADTVNVYLAFRAALVAVVEHNRRSALPIASLRAPALGAGVGGMPRRRAAIQMRAAFDAVAKPRVRQRDELLLEHERLRN